MDFTSGIKEIKFDELIRNNNPEHFEKQTENTGKWDR